MLRQRVITALVLVAILGLVLTVLRPWGFPLFALLAVGIVMGEWLSLLGVSRNRRATTACAMVILLGAIDASVVASRLALVVWIATAAIWAALGACLLITGRFPPSNRARGVQVAVALLLSSACWFALVAAYRNGMMFLMSIFALVWAADVAAYFAGRAFGKRKLAPSISPGKTWAGAIGGAVAALVVGAVASALPIFRDSFFAVLDRRWSIAPVLLVALLLAIFSIVGDLFESQLKRQRGVKDSGHLLPGHGGVFDRVDALLPVVPLAALASLVR